MSVAKCTSKTLVDLIENNEYGHACLIRAATQILNGKTGIVDHPSPVLAHELGLFVRSEAQLNRAESAISKSGLKFKVLDTKVSAVSGYVSICTMHLAKGLEFRAVAIMGCDDEVIPLQSRIESVGDDADLHEVYETERHLLYVACTRARDYLLITGIDPTSEFLDDLKMSH